MRQDRFTEQAWEAIIASQQLVGQFQHNQWDVEHILFSLLMQESGLVGDILRDLGVDVDAEQFCSFVRENDLDILGLSALLTTTMPRLKEAIDALETAGLRGKVKVMVGGALVTQVYADEIGADGFAPNAVEAVALVGQLVKK